MRADGQPDATGLADLAETVGPYWSAAKVTEVLGTTPAAGSVLALTTSDGVPVYPVSQFAQHDGHTTVVPGIGGMLSALDQYDPWTVAVLLETPANELNGATPLAWAKQGGDPETLAHLAKQVAREWAAGSAEQPVA